MTSEAAHLAIMELAKAVALDPAHDEHDWRALSLVLERHAHSDSVFGVYGYVYLADGTWRAADTRLQIVMPPSEPLVEALAKDEDDPGFRKCLLQITRPSGEANVEFEYEDLSRWEVNYEDWDELPELIRPRFDESAPAS